MSTENAQRGISGKSLGYQCIEIEHRALGRMLDTTRNFFPLCGREAELPREIPLDIAILHNHPLIISVLGLIVLTFDTADALLRRAVPGDGDERVRLAVMRKALTIHPELKDRKIFTDRQRSSTHLVSVMIAEHQLNHRRPTPSAVPSTCYRSSLACIASGDGAGSGTGKSCCSGSFR